MRMPTYSGPLGSPAFTASHSPLPAWLQVPPAHVAVPNGPVMVTSAVPLGEAAGDGLAVSDGGAVSDGALVEHAAAMKAMDARQARAATHARAVRRDGAWFALRVPHACAEGRDGVARGLRL